MRRWALGAALSGLLAAVGCAVHRTPGTPAPEPLRVEVENHNRADINLYVDRGSSRIRVGTVVAGDERRFTLHNYPSLPLNHLLFQVERIGVERTVATGVFSLPMVSVARGQTLHIRIQDLITTSDLEVLGDEAVGTPKRLP